MKTEAMIKSLEEKLINPAIRKSAGELDLLLNDGFIEIGSSGKCYNKSTVIESLRNESTQNITIKDFKIINLSDEVVTAIYIAVKKEGNTPKSFSRRCSIWKKENGSWQLYYHQGTNIDSLL